jgi:hypothetical protein
VRLDDDDGIDDDDGVDGDDDDGFDGEYDDGVDGGDEIDGDVERSLGDGAEAAGVSADDGDDGLGYARPDGNGDGNGDGAPTDADGGARPNGNGDDNGEGAPTDADDADDADPTASVRDAGGGKKKARPP